MKKKKNQQEENKPIDIETTYYNLRTPTFVVKDENEACPICNGCLWKLGKKIKCGHCGKVYNI